MLYELRPDLFPEGYLTPTETFVWEAFYAEREARRRALKKR
jgi:hypothetical protein